MFCSHCGVSLPSTARFCPQCGTPALEIKSAQPLVVSKVTPPPLAPVVSTPAPPPLPKSEPESVVDLQKISLQDDRNVASVMAILFGLAIAIFSDIDPAPVRLVPMVIYLSIAFGIRKNSRVAALAGLVLGFVNIVFALVLMAQIPSAQAAAAAMTPVLIITGFWIKFLLKSVRGTFAYHRHLATAQAA